MQKIDLYEKFLCYGEHVVKFKESYILTRNFQHFDERGIIGREERPLNNPHLVSASRYEARI